MNLALLAKLSWRLLLTFMPALCIYLAFRRHLDHSEAVALASVSFWIFSTLDRFSANSPPDDAARMASIDRRASVCLAQVATLRRIVDSMPGMLSDVPTRTMASDAGYHEGAFRVVFAKGAEAERARVRAHYTACLAEIARSSETDGAS